MLLSQINDSTRTMRSASNETLLRKYPQGYNYFDL